MGVLVSVCDIHPQRTSTLQKEIADELKTIIEIDNSWHSSPEKYRYMIDATPSADFIDASMITPDTYVAVPGFPSGFSPAATKKISDRYLHDPLQIGVAVMAVNACKQ
jgi:pyrrolysine biosynthesis protein PylD